MSSKSTAIAPAAAARDRSGPSVLGGAGTPPPGSGIWIQEPVVNWPLGSLRKPSSVVSDVSDTRIAVEDPSKPERPEGGMELPEVDIPIKGVETNQPQSGFRLITCVKPR